MIEVGNEVVYRSTLFPDVREDWEDLKKGKLTIGQNPRRALRCRNSQSREV